MRTRKPIEKTGWFSPDVKPVRPGIYETWFLDPFDLGFSHWDGRRWSSQSKTVRADRSTGVQWKHWRGLVKKGHHPIMEDL